MVHTDNDDNGISGQEVPLDGHLRPFVEAKFCHRAVKPLTRNIGHVERSIVTG